MMNFNWLHFDHFCIKPIRWLFLTLTILLLVACNGGTNETVQSATENANATVALSDDDDDPDDTPSPTSTPEPSALPTATQNTYVSTLYGFSVDLPPNWYAVNLISNEVSLASSQEALFGSGLAGHALVDEMKIMIGELESDIIDEAAEESLDAILDRLIVSIGVPNDEWLGERRYDSSETNDFIYQSIYSPAIDAQLYIGVAEIDEMYFTVLSMSTLDRTEEENEEQLTTLVASIQRLDSAQTTKGNRYQSPLYGLGFEQPDGLEIVHDVGNFLYTGRTQEEISHTYYGALEYGEFGSYIQIIPKDAALYCNEPFEAHAVLNNMFVADDPFAISGEIEEIQLDNGYLLKAQVDNNQAGVKNLMLALELDEVFILTMVFEGGDTVSNSTEALYMDLVMSMDYEPSKNIDYLFNIVNADIPLTETFNSPVGGITVDLPSGWTAEDVSTPTILFNVNFGAVATLMSPDGISSMIQAPTALDSVIGGGNSADLAGLGTDLGMILGSQFGNTETQQIRVNGTCLIEIGGEAFTGGYLHMISVVLPDGRKTAFVTATDDMPDEATRVAYENIIRAIAASAR